MTCNEYFQVKLFVIRVRVHVRVHVCDTLPYSIPRDGINRLWRVGKAEEQSSARAEERGETRDAMAVTGEGEGW